MPANARLLRPLIRRFRIFVILDQAKEIMLPCLAERQLILRQAREQLVGSWHIPAQRMIQQPPLDLVPPPMNPVKRELIRPFTLITSVFSTVMTGTLEIRYSLFTNSWSDNDAP